MTNNRFEQWWFEREGFGLRAERFTTPDDAARAAWNAALDAAADAVTDHQRDGRAWVPGSLWDTLARECAARIRALSRTTEDGK